MPSIKIVLWKIHVLALLFLALSACNRPSASSPWQAVDTSTTLTALATLPSPIPSVLHTATPAPSATPTLASTSTSLPTHTSTATLSPAPVGSPTPTIPSPTPTFDFPDVTVLMQANCRYGPGKAYLYAHGLYPGDRGEVRGRNFNSTWLYIKPENIDYFCWVSTSVVEVTGDVSTVLIAQTKLPKSTLYRAPSGVKAARDGNKVAISWKRVKMTEDDDRGYMLEVYVCQDRALIWMAVRTDNTFYEFTDEPGCKTASSGLLYTVEKHGYSDPVMIPWPKSQ